MIIVFFCEIDPFPKTECITVVRKQKAHFARYDILDIWTSDNGPQYTAHTFKQFSGSYEFQHITNSPGYSQYNGKAAPAVKMLIT